MIGKFVGPHYGADNTTDSSGATVFATTTASGGCSRRTSPAGWRFEHIGGPVKTLTASVKIGNLFDNHDISDYAGDAANGDPLFWRVPGRSVFFNSRPRCSSGDRPGPRRRGGALARGRGGG